MQLEGKGFFQTPGERGIKLGRSKGNATSTLLKKESKKERLKALSDHYTTTTKYAMVVRQQLTHHLQMVFRLDTEGSEVCQFGPWRKWERWENISQLPCGGHSSVGSLPGNAVFHYGSVKKSHLLQVTEQP